MIDAISPGQAGGNEREPELDTIRKDERARAIADRTIRRASRTDIKRHWHSMGALIRPIHRVRADLGNRSTNTAGAASKIHEEAAVARPRIGQSE
jgi:hypothetical protein